MVLLDIIFYLIQDYIPIKGIPLEITSKTKQNEKNKEHYTASRIYIFGFSTGTGTNGDHYFNRGYFSIGE